MDKKEKIILKYLELTYGNREVYENEKSIGINGVLIYHKSLNQIGVVGKVHLDLVSWFGSGNYHKVVNKWFSEKYKLYVIPQFLFELGDIYLYETYNYRKTTYHIGRLFDRR